jgi:hypothetical protein
MRPRQYFVTLVSYPNGEPPLRRVIEVMAYDAADAVTQARVKNPTEAIHGVHPEYPEDEEE